MKRIVITGTGLAGLSTAYYLLKSSNTPLEIVLIEKDNRTGGRVLSKDINGIPCDLGAFMVFPWYKHFKSLVKDLGLKTQLKKFKSNKEFYQFKSDKTLIEDKNINLLPRKKVPLFKHLIKPFILGKLSFYNPDLYIYKQSSFAEILTKLLPKEKLLINTYQILLNSYTYPGLDNFPAILGFSLWVKLFQNDFFNKCESFQDNATEYLIRRLEEYIKSKGAKFLMNTEVKSVFSNKIITNKEIIEFDYAVLTHTVCTSYKSVLENIPLPCYTSHYTTLVEYENPIFIKDTDRYFVTYRGRNTDENPCVVSFGSPYSISGLGKEFLLANIYVPPNKYTMFTTGDLKDLLDQQISPIIRPNRLLRINHSVFWDNTMPIVDTRFLREVRLRQGRDNVYFAGDYTGIPSMETAVYSGKKAANKILRLL